MPRSSKYPLSFRLPHQNPMSISLHLVPAIYPAHFSSLHLITRKIRVQ
jgi:hypothetical protein